MTDLIALEIARLRRASTNGLRQKYKEIFGRSPPPSWNRPHLWRRIAFRVQELRFGGLSPVSREIIACETERLEPPERRGNGAGARRSKSRTRNRAKRDRRIPMPGTIISRDYKSQRIEVKVLENGFEYERLVYPSLSAVAKTVTGSHWNGIQFFGLK